MTFQIDAIIARKRIDPHAHAFTFGGFHSRIILSVIMPTKVKKL